MADDHRMPRVEDLLAFDIPSEIRHVTEALDEIDYPAFALDARGRVIAWNRPIEELTGVDRRAIVGQGESAHGAALFVERRPTLADAVITGGGMYPYRWYDVRVVENGRIVATSRVPLPGGMSGTSLAAPLYEEGVCAGSIEVIIPGPKGLPQSDSLSAALAHSDDLIFVLEASGILSHFSWTEADQYDLDPTSIPGRRVADVFSVDDAATLLKIAEEVRVSGETRSFHRTLRCGSSVCAFRIIMTPALPIGDQPRGVIAICRRDGSTPYVTDQVEDLRRTAELLNRLISTDIYNGNMVAATAAGMLQERIDEEGGEILRRLQNAVAQNNLIIKNVELLQTLNQFRMPVEPLDLDTPIRQAIEEFPGAQIAYNGSHTCVWANELLKTVFSNLISNSLRHGGMRVSISITVEAQEENVTITVADTGRGIPDAQKPTIFSIFSQSGPESSGGRGLGLHIVRTLVTSCGDRVWAADRVPGRPGDGAAIKILLHRC